MRLMFVPWTIFRKLLYAALFVFAFNLPMAQIGAFIVISIVTLLWQIILRPYRKKSDSILCVLSEVIMLISLVMIFPFNFPTLPPLVKAILSWTLVAIMFGTIMGIIAYMWYVKIKMIRASYKQRPKNKLAPNEEALVRLPKS